MRTDNHRSKMENLLKYTKQDAEQMELENGMIFIPHSVENTHSWGHKTDGKISFHNSMSTAIGTRVRVTLKSAVLFRR